MHSCSAWQAAFKWPKLTHVNMKSGFHNDDDDGEYSSGGLFLSEFVSFSIVILFILFQFPPQKEDRKHGNFAHSSTF